ncbi:MAG: hypothetical protein HFJ52_02455 [Clostridia bacterium]|nr:hypothetical protein [Clostridia bacterium]
MITEKSQTRTKEDTSNINKLYAEHLLKKVKIAEEQIANGEVITIEELKEFIDGLEAEYVARNTEFYKSYISENNFNL